MTDDRINDLEITLAHHEQQIHDLSEMINRQWKDIDVLKRRLEITLNKLEELQNAPASADGRTVSEIAASEKPPHY